MRRIICLNNYRMTLLYLNNDDISGHFYPLYRLRLYNVNFCVFAIPSLAYIHDILLRIVLTPAFNNVIPLDSDLVINNVPVHFTFYWFDCYCADLPRIELGQHGSEPFALPLCYRSSGKQRY